MAGLDPAISCAASDPRVEPADDDENWIDGKIAAIAGHIDRH
jgi:hypothetical protein